MATWRQHLEFNPVTFVRENSELGPDQDSPRKHRKRVETNHELDGHSAKQLYEEIVGLDESQSPGADVSESSYSHCLVVPSESTSSRLSVTKTGETNLNKTHRQKSSRKKSSGSTKPSRKTKVESYQRRHTVISLLSCAQSGDEAGVRSALQSGVDVNGCDQYGWTALMCAAESGQKRIARLLRLHGADTSIRDKNGKTAMDIAAKRKNVSVVDILKHEHEHKEKLVKSSSSAKHVKTSDTFFCDTCREQFSSRSSHLSSTLHLFNMNSAPKPISYQIPPSNIGYKMLLNKGWDEDKGLGPEGQGQKFPVKTILKRDRKGLGGVKASKPKISHFSANDLEAIKSRQKRRRERSATINKKAVLANQRKDRKKEIAFRREFTQCLD